jgi:hypothetical protein
VLRTPPPDEAAPGGLTSGRSMSTARPLFMRPQPLPALCPQAGTWYAESVTTPDVIAVGNMLWCYVGAIAGGHERIVVMQLDPVALRVPVSLSGPARLALDVGAPGSFDAEHVMDPAAVVIGPRVFLYYSALGAGPDSIGLATSADGVTFTRSLERVLIGRAPEAVVHDGRVFLFHVRETIAGGYAIHLATSIDGIGFSEAGSGPVLDPGDAGSWDSRTVTTPRLFARGGFYYMLYAGDDETRDEPRAFGLARSRDLVRWTRYARNPVFRRGWPGAWDDGAVWFGTVFEWNDTLYLFYEGTSRAALRDGANASAAGVALCRITAFDRCVADWRDA